MLRTWTTFLLIFAVVLPSLMPATTVAHLIQSTSPPEQVQDLEAEHSAHCSCVHCPGAKLCCCTIAETDSEQAQLKQACEASAERLAQMARMVRALPEPQCYFSAVESALERHIPIQHRVVSLFPTTLEPPPRLGS